MRNWSYEFTLYKTELIGLDGVAYKTTYTLSAYSPKLPDVEFNHDVLQTADFYNPTWLINFLRNNGWTEKQLLKFNEAETYLLVDEAVSMEGVRV
ncbi:hypothetical protein QU593_10085 [Rossellomorea marisflavi]|uniref:hypothetical protein n=1 Tax=Rossellomorea marisflavi TaxID=189381 RepID=UPI0025AFA6CC|nr:hypothetical protein [Rossellomorea marisflavi]WJV20753.1 hypothetical protein QU593_10085 [Rossellomorea marisflavi]